MTSAALTAARRWSVRWLARAGHLRLRGLLHGARRDRRDRSRPHDCRRREPEARRQANSTLIKVLLNKMWTDPLVGGVESYVSLTASWAAFVASVLVAATLLLSRRAGWLNMAVLVGLWLATAGESCRLHGPDRVRPAHRRVRLAGGGPDGGGGHLAQKSLVPPGRAMPAGERPTARLVT